MSKIGVACLQGDFQKHFEALDRLGVPASQQEAVRDADDLEDVGHLILPGGESTTVGLLMNRFGLGPAIQQRAKQDLAVWGTCMGMILLAKDIEDRPAQYRLSLLDVSVSRNAFGPQIHSFEELIQFAGLEEPVLGVFIRAPVVTRLGPCVQVLARYDDAVVAVREGRLLGTSFHPELTDDKRVHEYFLSM